MQEIKIQHQRSENLFTVGNHLIAIRKVVVKKKEKNKECWETYEEKKKTFAVLVKM